MPDIYILAYLTKKYNMKFLISSIVCFCCRGSEVTFSHLQLLLQNQVGGGVNFKQTWHKTFLSTKQFKFVQMKGYSLFQGGMITTV